MSQLAVVGKLRNPKIDRAIAHVGKAFGGEAFDELYHVFDMVGSPHHVFRFRDAQDALVGQESINIFGRVITYIELGLGGFGDDSIVHIGKIGHLGDFKAARTQKAAQDILENERPKIANMSEVVDRGAAGVHPYLPWMQGHERLVFSPKRILENNIAHRSCGILGRSAFTNHDRVQYARRESAHAMR